MTSKLHLGIIAFIVSFTAFAQPNSKMLKSIPNESYCVVSLNTSNIAEKLDIERIKALPVIKTAFDELKKGAHKDSVTLKKFYEDPNSLGVALEPSITAFFHFTESEHDDPIGFAGAMIPLSNGIKFDLLLKNVLQGKYDEVKSGKGYKYLPQGNAVIAWNKKYLTFYTAFDFKGKHLLDEHLERVYKGDAKKSLLLNKEYKTFSSRKNDFSIWVDVNKVERLIKNASQLLATPNPNMISFQTSSIEFELNFEDGEIALASKQHHSPELQDLINKSYSQRINRDMLKYISNEELLGFAGLSVNLEVVREMYDNKYTTLYDTIYNSASREIIKDLVKNDSIVKSLRNSIHTDAEEAEVVPAEEEDVVEYTETPANNNEGLSYEQRDSIWTLIYDREDSIADYYYNSRDSIISSVLGKYGLKKDDLWNAFTGDILFASNGTFEVVDTFYTYEYVENQDGEWAYDEVRKTRTFPAPLFKTLVGINYPGAIKMALDDIITLAKENLPDFKIEKEGDYYLINAKYTTLYLGVFNDSYLLLTNNKELIDTAGSNGYDNNLANSNEFDYLTKGSPSFLYANINATLKKSEKGAPEQVDLFKLFEETFVSFDAATKQDDRGGYSGKSSINLSKKDDNAVHILFDLANKIYHYYRAFK